MVDQALDLTRSEMRCLDLFCGAGGSAMGLHRAGFDLVGIDNRPQPHYPFQFIQADALKPPVRFEDFDLIWASPPCQGYSRTRHLPWLKNKVHPMLIEPIREMFAALNVLHIIENVGDSPLIGISLRGGMFGLPFKRLRRFEANFHIHVPPYVKEPVGLSGKQFGGRLSKQHKQMGEVGGQAIPPEYSEWIGKYAIIALRERLAGHPEHMMPNLG